MLTVTTWNWPPSTSRFLSPSARALSWMVQGQDDRLASRDEIAQVNGPPIRAHERQVEIDRVAQPLVDGHALKLLRNGLLSRAGRIRLAGGGPVGLRGHVGPDRLRPNHTPEAGAERRTRDHPSPSYPSR
jgi:hypothetical protein